MKLLRKAQVGGLQGFILSIVTVAIVLAIGLIVMNELKGATKLLRTTTVINESVGDGESLGGGGELFIGAGACRNETMADIALGVNCNITNEGVVSLGGLNFTGASDGFIDYSHYTPTAAYNSSGTIITKLATVPTWLGIIIVVALAFIVLSFFIGKRQ